MSWKRPFSPRDGRATDFILRTMHARQLIEYVKQLSSVEVRIPSSVDVARLNVTGIAQDERAGPGELAWVSDVVARTEPERLSSFAGSVLICPRSAVSQASPSCVVIGAESPKTLFAQVLDRFFSHLASITWPGAHAHVATDAVIGERVELGPGVVIGSRVVIGNDVHIGPNTCIANAHISDFVRIGCNCSIGLAGFGYSRDEHGSWIRFPHLGGVRIESEVEIGSNTCIDRGSLGDTIIRRGAKIDNLVHVAHNCDIGDAALLIANSMIGGSTVVGASAWVAPSSAINNKLSVGKGATIGTGAVVIRDVPDGGTVVGNPAKPLSR